MTRTFYKNLGTATIAAALLMSIATGLSFYAAHRERGRAEAFIRQVRQLQVGRSSFQDLATLRSKYSSNVTVSSKCDTDECSATFWFRNTWLGRLHLSRPAYLYSVLTLSEGTIKSIDIGGGCYGHNGGLYTVNMVESLPNTVFSETFRVGGTQASGKRASIVVHLTPSAPAPQRESAYGFNGSSLDRFGACSDANDILPTVH